jgi:hypothetical protein
MEEMMNKIPQIDSVTELARFWDTHSLTEFEEELEEVREPVFSRGEQSVVRIPLRADQAAALHRIAQSKGMDDTDLLREWVSEKLQAS